MVIIGRAVGEAGLAAAIGVHHVEFEVFWGAGHDGTTKSKGLANAVDANAVPSSTGAVAAAVAGSTAAGVVVVDAAELAFAAVLTAVGVLLPPPQAAATRATAVPRTVKHAFEVRIACSFASMPKRRWTLRVVHRAIRG